MTISPPPKNRQTTQSPSTNVNQAYNPANYVGDSFMKRARDTEGYKKTKQTYTGKVLFIREIYQSQMKEYSDDFINHIVQESGYHNTPADQRIFKEVRVYVPEISGCLPIPDMEYIYEFIDKVNAANAPSSGALDSLRGLATQRKLEPFNTDYNSRQIILQIDRLARMPRFYLASISEHDIANNSLVSVQFPDENDLTAGIITKAKK